MVAPAASRIPWCENPEDEKAPFSPSYDFCDQNLPKDEVYLVGINFNGQDEFIRLAPQTLSFEGKPRIGIWHCALPLGDNPQVCTHHNSAIAEPVLKACLLSQLSVEAPLIENLPVTSLRHFLDLKIMEALQQKGPTCVHLTYEEFDYAPIVLVQIANGCIEREALEKK